MFVASTMNMKNVLVRGSSSFGTEHIDIPSRLKGTSLGPRLGPRLRIKGLYQTLQELSTQVHDDAIRMM